METLLSPRQAASIIGLSESTVRRWCDRREVSFQLTPGGHRRLLRSSVLARAQRLGLELDDSASAAVIGPAHAADSSALSGQLYQLLVDGRLGDAQRLILELISQSMPVASACDAVIAPAMRRVGAAWEAGTLNVFEEHAASYAVSAALGAAQLALPKPLTTGPIVVCGALSGDPYVLGPMMAGLVMQAEGCQPWVTGSDTPADEFLKAVVARRATMLTISVGCIADHPRLVADLNRLYEAVAARGCLLAIGGRALDRGLRTQLRADFFGDTMTHLATFARGHVANRHLASPKDAR
ncbi:MAG: excisionase family DNA binding protein [Myxococcota bacterium]|jgi:excisionase family DNA binding protein